MCSGFGSILSCSRSICSWLLQKKVTSASSTPARGTTAADDESRGPRACRGPHCALLFLSGCHLSRRPLTICLLASPSSAGPDFPEALGVATALRGMGPPVLPRRPLSALGVATALRQCSTPSPSNRSASSRTMWAQALYIFSFSRCRFAFFQILYSGKKAKKEANCCRATTR